ncbi:hypothetical protein F5Y12DRAFT_717705 [Xylaria sp. FL1777]|nr:hypothetical protein F5Y12DRAFT_717705 [Xylaria sp. FL1777]
MDLAIDADLLSLLVLSAWGTSKLPATGDSFKMSKQTLLVLETKILASARIRRLRHEAKLLLMHAGDRKAQGTGYWAVLELAVW